MKTKAPLRQRARPTSNIGFDFVVAERPTYIPGSGPPLAPITVMPPKDKDGYIIGMVELYKTPHYIVGYHQQPHLRVSVRLPNILKWVSPWALEKWETERYDAEEAERERIELPLIRAKEERRKKKLPRAGLFDVSRKRKRTFFEETDTPTSGTKKSSGRPRGPAGRNQPMEKQVTFKSPIQSQHSQQQPSLTAPPRGLANRTVLDPDSDDEISTATDIAIERQLNNGLIPRSFESSQSDSPPASKRTIRPQSTYTIDTSREESRDASPSTQNPSSRPFLARDAIAAMSSREALKLYEDLEERKPSKPQTLADKYSLIKRKPESLTFKGGHIGLAGPSRSLAQATTEDEETQMPEEDEDQLAGSEPEEEYEVNEITGHEIRYSADGTIEDWYLVDWVGDWDSTWEPAANIGEGAIEAYEDKIRLIEELKRRAQARRDSSDPNSLFVSEEGKGKGKDVVRGQIVDDDDDEDETDEDDVDEEMQ